MNATIRIISALGQAVETWKRVTIVDAWETIQVTLSGEELDAEAIFDAIIEAFPRYRWKRIVGHYEIEGSPPTPWHPDIRITVAGTRQLLAPSDREGE